MDRIQFLKTLGISILSPMVLTVYSEGKAKEIPVQKFKPKQWPIYPETIEYSFLHSCGEIINVMFTYVKIERNGVQYLIPVKESGIDNIYNDQIKSRFEYNVKMVEENFIVDTSNPLIFETAFIIKYDKNIHK